MDMEFNYFFLVVGFLWREVEDKALIDYIALGVIDFLVVGLSFLNLMSLKGILP